MEFNVKQSAHSRAWGDTRAFSPSPNEVEYTGEVVSAFEEAQAKGLGAISLEGKMIDYMNYRQAKDLVSLVKFITEKEEKRQQASYINLARFFLTATSPVA